jgi:hypothetical protein
MTFLVEQCTLENSCDAFLLTIWNKVRGDTALTSQKTGISIDSLTSFVLFFFRLSRSLFV